MLLKQENRIKKGDCRLQGKTSFMINLLRRRKSKTYRLKELYHDILKNPEHFDDNVKEAAVLQVY